MIENFIGAKIFPLQFSHFVVSLFPKIIKALFFFFILPPIFLLSSPKSTTKHSIPTLSPQKPFPLFFLSLSFSFTIHFSLSWKMKRPSLVRSITQASLSNDSNLKLSLSTHWFPLSVSVSVSVSYNYDVCLKPQSFYLLLELILVSLNLLDLIVVALISVFYMLVFDDFTFWLGFL